MNKWMMEWPNITQHSANDDTYEQHLALEILAALYAPLVDYSGTLLLLWDGFRLYPI